MSKPSSQHHIHRIDNDDKRTHSWLVQVQRRGKIVFQYFSDNLYGGKRKALTAAQQYRDQLLDQMQDEQYPLWRRNRKRRNNTSGIVGVGRYLARETVGGKLVERAFWQAFWDGSDGKRHSRKFSVSKYGEAKAKSLARAARLQAMAIAVGDSK